MGHFAARRTKEVGLKQFRITAFGYAMDKMKARAWVQAELPAFPAETLQRQRLLAERCVAGCHAAAGPLVVAVKQGLFDNPTEAPGDFSAVRNALWDATKEDFFELMRSLADSLEFDNGKAAERFAQTIRGKALAIFDDFCPLDGFEHGKMQRPIAARYFLESALRGYGKKTGQAFFAALGLPPPQPAQRKTTKEPA